MRVLRIPAYYEPERYANLHLDKDIYKAFEKASIETEMYISTPTRGIDTGKIQKKDEENKTKKPQDGKEI